MSTIDTINTYAAAEEYILGIPKFTRKNNMEHTRTFLKHLGNLQEEVKTIHVAGTNGKGSVCAYLRSILQEAGFTTGMFISPHLVSMRERFQINGEMVSEDAFLWAFKKVADKLADMPENLREIAYHPTFFEYLFFMAMVLFDRYRVDYVIMETGLGGRLDATNSIDQKEVCIITSIGYDHMEYLGETLSDIAAEKAGIFRKNVPVVYFDKNKEVTETLEKCAKQVETKTFPVSFQAIKEINTAHKTIDFSFQSNYYGYIRLRVSTIALYQIENAVLAVNAIAQIADREKVTVKNLQEGIRKAHWEGRMEEIMPSVYLDGAHNTDGIQAFLRTVEKDGCTGRRRLLFSMVKEKQYQTVIAMLVQAGLFDEIGIVALQDARALPLQELEDTFRQYTEAAIQKYDRIENALQDIISGRHVEDRVYVVGSLYLVGEVKALLRRHSHDKF
ncbi:MAG: bifunctional folylpolyglutamate synthase/dihydrofolate synthase [Lachnospiraceae bacterium]|nr:bifunctional folylpolyglutamate synthase/dihydrofolate synthase [Lachnospiraceae bacterium]